MKPRRFVLMLLTQHTTLIMLTDGTWVSLATFLAGKVPRYKARIFTSRRRAQEFRQEWPAWQEMGIGLLPL